MVGKGSGLQAMGDIGRDRSVEVIATDGRGRVNGPRISFDGFENVALRAVGGDLVTGRSLGDGAAR